MLDTLEGLLFGAIVSGLLARVALIPVFHKKRLFKYGITVEGLIVGEQEVEGADSTTTLAIVQFRTPEGREMVVVAYEGDGGKVPIGKRVTVGYWPGNPYKVFILEYSYALFWILFYIGIFIMLCFLGRLIMFLCL